MIDLQGYGPRLIEGAGVTIQLAVLSLILAIILGLLTASAKMSRNWFLRRTATVYTTLIRGVPDLVLMMLLFFGGQILVNNFFYWLADATDGRIDIFLDFNQFVSGVLTIGFIFGAYMTETFRGAFMSVDVGQIEAGKAYGMTPWQIFSRIMFPQMMRHALPGIGNNWLVLLKTTALVSVIGLSDMVRLASEAAKATHEPFRFLLPVIIGFLLMTAFSEWGLKRLEQKYSAGVVKG